MCRNMNQRGFSLIMAIFLIAVLGGIAVFIGRVSTMQHQSSALDEEGAMAYQAARAGIEWGVYQAVIVDNGAGTGCDADAEFTLPLTVPATPDTPQHTVNYTVTVTCALTATTEGSTPINVYNLIATATNASGGNYGVERQLTATVAK
jgi:MSHA biogenesis protein MshP